MEHIINPPATMRPAPLWSWNDKLEPDELRRQIQEIARQGWGGFFMHPRVGYTTHYLSEAWMEAVHTSIDEAQKLGINAWIYDEDRWPSGYGAGVVAEIDPAYRARALVIRQAGTERDNDTILQEVTVGGRPHVICEQVANLGNEWFNGSTYPDLMNPEAMRAFLDNVLERYREACGEHFGKTIPGVFTDEPLYLHNSSFDAVAVPWSTYLPDFFEKLKGYDIRAHLPQLFVEEGDYRRIRFDFYDAASRLFRESFTKQYFAWCEQHGLKFTGHFQAEENLRLQLQWTGDVMAHYPWMHWPGVDKLERDVAEIALVKQLSSVTDQLQKEHAFCEAFGISGTHVSFFHRKWIGDWLAGLGINFVNPHLSLYSMRGTRKRDCPPNLFYQQPWWDDEAGFAAYQARLCAAMSEGKRRVEVLILQPLSSAWCEYSPLHWDNKYAAVEVFDGPYQELAQRLLQAQIDFHIGNETIMADHARVEGDRLFIGQHGYSIVVLPPMINLHEHTAALLRQFASQDGAVVITGNPPAYRSGVAQALELANAHYAPRLMETVKEVQGLVGPRVQAFDHHTGQVARDVCVHSRDVAGGARHLLVNTAEHRAVRLTVELPSSDRGCVAAFDLASGLVQPIELDERGRCDITLEAAGSVLLLSGDEALTSTDRSSPLLGSGAWCGFAPGGTTVAVADQFAIEFAEGNVLRLDDIFLELGGHEVYNGPVAGAWRDHFYAAEDGTPFRATYSFEAACEIESAEAVIDSAEHLDSILFNGKTVTPLRRAGEPLTFDPSRSWKDIAHTRVPLGGIMRGVNTLVIAGRKLNVSKPSGIAHRRTQPGAEPQETQLEEALVIGRFNLQQTAPGTFRVAPFYAPTSGDLTTQGFPFYAGRATYLVPVNIDSLPQSPLWLMLHGLEAAAARVIVNGDHLATIRWLPHAVDLSGHLRVGGNTIAIELATTLNNAMGPVRFAEALAQRRVVPTQFFDMPRYQRAYDLAPFGLQSMTIVGK